LNVRPLPPQGSALAKLSYAPLHLKYYITRGGFCQAFLAKTAKKTSKKMPEKLSAKISKKLLQLRRFSAKIV